jgi:tRNA A37 threonylcarbamoyladenosine modification protein TsaB
MAALVPEVALAFKQNAPVVHVSLTVAYASTESTDKTMTIVAIDNNLR